MQQLSLVHKEYKVLDIMKFVMAIVVVAIHTCPEMSLKSITLREIIEDIYSIAVPFFFMASGFLLFRKISFPLDRDGEIRILSYLKKIGRLYLVWTTIYLPLTIYGFWMDGIPFSKSVMIFFRNILLVGENFMSWPLWYLLALIVAVGMIYVLLKLKLSKNWILAIGTFVAVMGVGLDYCNENAILQPITDLYFSAFLKTRNGIFVGFFFVALGMFLSYKETLSLPLLLATGLLGVAGIIIGIPLSNALVVWAIFVLSISQNCKSINAEIAVKYRLMSSIVYYIHMLWMAIFVLIFRFDKGIVLFSLVMIISVVSSFVLMKYKSRYMFLMCFN